MAVTNMIDDWSAVLNGQLVSVVPVDATSPAAAGQVTSGQQGAAVSTLPGLTTPMGTAGDAAAGLQNPWDGPWWHNQLLWIVIMIAVGYAMLRYVHWQERE